MSSAVSAVQALGGNAGDHVVRTEFMITPRSSPFRREGQGERVTRIPLCRMMDMDSGAISQLASIKTEQEQAAANPAPAEPTANLTLIETAERATGQLVNPEVTHRGRNRDPSASARQPSGALSTPGVEMAAYPQNPLMRDASRNRRVALWLARRGAKAQTEY